MFFFTPLQQAALGGMMYQKNKIAIDQQKQLEEQTKTLKSIEEQNAKLLKKIEDQQKELDFIRRLEESKRRRGLI